VLRISQLSVFAALMTASFAVSAQQNFAGFLCCNMRSDGKVFNDINYVDPKTHIIPVGTPIKITGYAKNRLKVEIDGHSQDFKNSYSRDLPLDVFAKRYVVADDPTVKIANFPDKTREAIATARLVKGMTREQVIMSQGYPVSTENQFEGKIWKFWLDFQTEFDVLFDDENRLSYVEATPAAKARVLME
jgi:hypothetical protein